jgi:hypothetical protein
MNREEFTNNLGFVAVQFGFCCGKPVKAAFLADEEGKLIPGQCAINISEPDHNGRREVTVIFEVMAEVPEGCATTFNYK